MNLQGTTAAGDCPSITNPVSRVSASNELPSATQNNSTSAVTITVTCPTPPTTTTTTTTPVVLGEVIVREAPAVAPRQLPTTGSDSQLLLVVSGMLLMLGGPLVASGEGWAPRSMRRRQS